jgi:hypothetical protein
MRAKMGHDAEKVALPVSFLRAIAAFTFPIHAAEIRTYVRHSGPPPPRSEARGFRRRGGGRSLLADGRSR